MNGVVRYNLAVRNVLLIIQILVSILLILAILAQTKGKGFGRSLAGNVSFTRRGLEKVVFRATFILVAIFIIVSILQLVI